MLYVASAAEPSVGGAASLGGCAAASLGSLPEFARACDGQIFSIARTFFEDSDLRVVESIERPGYEHAHIADGKKYCHSDDLVHAFSHDPRKETPKATREMCIGDWAAVRATLTSGRF